MARPLRPYPRAQWPQTFFQSFKKRAFFLVAKPLSPPPSQWPGHSKRPFFAVFLSINRTVRRFTFVFCGMFYLSLSLFIYLSLYPSLIYHLCFALYPSVSLSLSHSIYIRLSISLSLSSLFLFLFIQVTEESWVNKISSFII